MGSPTDLSSILSSQARFRVIEVLALLSVGLKLREIERETNLGIRSIQLATQSLLEEGVLKKNREGFFTLHSKSPTGELLRGLFQYLRDERIRKNASTFSYRAKSVIQFSDELVHLIHQARSSS